jgi:hypothetical protein
MDDGARPRDVDDLLIQLQGLAEHSAEIGRVQWRLATHVRRSLEPDA